MCFTHAARPLDNASTVVLASFTFATTRLDYSGGEPGWKTVTHPALGTESFVQDYTFALGHFPGPFAIDCLKRTRGV